MQMFFGVELVPEELPCCVDLPPGALLHLTQATLSIDTQAGERVGVSIAVTKDGPHVLICSLKEGTCESQSLNLLLDSYAEFKVVGNVSVHLTGYYLPDHDQEDFVGNKEGEPENNKDEGSQRGVKTAEDLKATAIHDHKHRDGAPSMRDNKHEVCKNGQTQPSDIKSDLHGVPTHLKTAPLQDKGPFSSPLHPPNAEMQHMMAPSFAHENGNVSWVVTLNTPREDIGHQVEKALCYGPVAILTYILNQKSFNNCTTGPYLINRVPLLHIPDQHLSRTRPHPQRSSGRWLIIRGKLAAMTDMILGPCESVHFREDVYVLENPRPITGRDYIFMPVSELANVATTAVSEAGTAAEAFSAFRSDGVGILTTPVTVQSKVAALLDERGGKWEDPLELKSHPSLGPGAVKAPMQAPGPNVKEAMEEPSQKGEAKAPSQDVPESRPLHHIASPSFSQEKGAIKDISWVVTPNTPQRDIGHQVDNALCHGHIAILTHIQNQKKFDICTTGPYLINRVPPLPFPEQHLSRTPQYPHSSGHWMTILRKHRAGDLMPLDPHRRVRFQEDVYVLKNPWPVTNKVT